MSRSLEVAEVQHSIVKRVQDLEQQNKFLMVSKDQKKQLAQFHELRDGIGVFKP